MGILYRNKILNYSSQWNWLLVYIYIYIYYIGGDLNKFIKSQEFKGKYRFLESIRLFSETVEGIFLSHSLNIVHLDIKPANIFLDKFWINNKNSKAGHAKIGDFGIANQVGNIYTTTDRGSVHYVPPEVWKGEQFKFEPDCFALGVLFYLLIVEKLPFDDIYVENISRQILEDDWDHETLYSKLDNQYFLNGKEGKAKDLICKLLEGMMEKERKKRLGVMEIIGIYIYIYIYNLIDLLGEITKLISYSFPGIVYQRPSDKIPGFEKHDHFSNKGLKPERKINDFYTIYLVQQDV